MKTTTAMYLGNHVLWHGSVCKVQGNVRLCIKMDPALNESTYMDVELLIPQDL